MSATPIMSAAPSRKPSTISFSRRPPNTPITMAMRKNQMDASLKYHSPSGLPVSRPLQGMTVHASAASSYTPPAVKMSTPKSAQGIKPQIMMTKETPNSARATLRLAVNSRAAGPSAAEAAPSPHASSAAWRSCRDKMVEPLSRRTRLA